MENKTPEKPSTAAEPTSAPSSPEDDAVREKVIDALKTCYDPEIPVNIYELGLIYSIDISTDPKSGDADPVGTSDAVEKDGDASKPEPARPLPTGPMVSISMTLTSPACPVAGTLPPQVEQTVRAVPEVGDARVTLVWEPTWTPEKMTEAAKLQLNMF